jgi:hypothetical protein
MLTQCATAAVLFGTGDVVAQQIVEKKGKEHDVRKYIPYSSEVIDSDPSVL